MARISPAPYMREQSVAGHDVDALERGYVPRGLVHQLFEELNISRQCATGAGGHLIPEYAEGPNGGFFAVELGFGRWNPEKDVLQTTRTVRSDNAGRKQRLKQEHEEQQKKLLAEAQRLGIRPDLQRWRDAEGCGGCGSCVPGARATPRVRLAGRFSDWRSSASWTPGSKARALREAEAVVGVFRSLAALVRRAERERRSKAYQARRDRAAAARATMQARRAEEKQMRRAARRALGPASTTRR